MAWASFFVAVRRFSSLRPFVFLSKIAYPAFVTGLKLPTFGLSTQLSAAGAGGTDVIFLLCRLILWGKSGNWKFSGSQIVNINPLAVNCCSSCNNEVPEQGFVLKFQNWTEKRDCVEANNFFLVGTDSAIKSVEMSGINEARKLVLRCCFQTET